MGCKLVQILLEMWKNAKRQNTNVTIDNTQKTKYNNDIKKTQNKYDKIQPSTYKAKNKDNGCIFSYLFCFVTV